MASKSKLKIPSTMELIRSIRTIRFEWAHKTAQQQWCYLFGIGKAFSGFIRLNLFEDGVQAVHWFSYFGLVYVGDYLILMIYTAYHFISHGEFTKFLPCTCLFCPIGAYAPYIWTVVSQNRKRYHSLVEFGGRYIYRNDNEKTEYNRICAEAMRITVRRFLMKAIGMIVAGYVGASGPLYAYFFLDYKTSTTELKFPFIEPDSNAEFIANISLQFIILFHGTCISFGIEIMVQLSENVAIVTPKLVKHKLQKLIDQHLRKEISGAQLRLAFKDIGKQTLDYDNYMTSIKDFLYLRSLVTPSLYTYGIAMAIFCHMKMQFIAGYGMAFMCLVQMYFICDFGECIENNGFAEEFYDTEWTSLPLDLQKDLILLINRQQNAVMYTEGPFRTINRELFKIVANKIYAFVMFLRDFTA